MPGSRTRNWSAWSSGSGGGGGPIKTNDQKTSDYIPMKLTAALLLTAAVALAETPSAGPLGFTATTDKVAGAPDAIRINVIRWSTDAERDQLLSAWNLT